MSRWILALALVALAACSKSPQPAPAALASVSLLPCGDTALDKQIDENSGLACSRRYPGVIWTHNDSGDWNRIFALGERGQAIAEIRVEGADNIDWEDITVDTAGNLYVGDFGNNDNTRRDLTVYKFEEPDPRQGKELVVRAKRLRFRYPDQTAFPDPARKNFDAEALFWTEGHLYVLTKHRSDTDTVLYRFPSDWPEDGEVVVERVGSFDVGGAFRPFGGMVTAADVTPDGRYLAVLTYHAVFVFERPDQGDNYLSRLVNEIELDQLVLKQCEGIAWQGSDLLISNEDGEIHRLERPLRATRYPAPPAALAN